MPEKARRPPYVVFSLWLFFGLLVSPPPPPPPSLLRARALYLSLALSLSLLLSLSLFLQPLCSALRLCTYTHTVYVHTYCVRTHILCTYTHTVYACSLPFFPLLLAPYTLFMLFRLLFAYEFSAIRLIDDNMINKRRNNDPPSHAERGINEI